MRRILVGLIVLGVVVYLLPLLLRAYVETIELPLLEYRADKGTVFQYPDYNPRAETFAASPPYRFVVVRDVADAFSETYYYSDGAIKECVYRAGETDPSLMTIVSRGNRVRFFPSLLGLLILMVVALLGSPRRADDGKLHFRKRSHAVWFLYGFALFVYPILFGLLRIWPLQQSL